jgi:hypothetical protein
MKKELIKSLINELESEGYDVEGILSEDGIMNGNYGELSWSYFDDIKEDELKDYLIDIIEE